MHFLYQDLRRKTIVRLSGYALLLILWLGAFYASIIMAYEEFISLWYMPAGVALGGFLIVGKRAFIPVFLGIFYVSLHFDKIWGITFDPTHIAAALLFSLAHTVSYGFGGLAARYWLKHFTNLPIALHIIGLLVLFAAAALLAALSGLSVWQFTTETNDHIMKTGWFAWWLGDLIGVMVIAPVDRKSTRLNSSHVRISYAVFCLKKKKKNKTHTTQ